MHLPRSLPFVAALHFCITLDQANAAGQKSTPKQLAAGYTFMEYAHEFFVCAPHEDTCVSAHMIGWRQPFILTRDEGAEPGWSVIDTKSHKETYISERSRLPAELKDIRLYPAAIAWQKLSFTRTLW